MSKSRNKRTPERVLAPSDLEQAKSAVLNTLTFVSGQRTYDQAINGFANGGLSPSGSRFCGRDYAFQPPRAGPDPPSQIPRL